MVTRTLPFKPGARDKPTDELPSIPPEEMEHQQSVAEMLKHANEQIALTRQYPGRKPPPRDA